MVCIYQGERRKWHPLVGSPAPLARRTERREVSSDRQRGGWVGGWSEEAGCVVLYCCHALRCTPALGAAHRCYTLSRALYLRLPHRHRSHSSVALVHCSTP